ncbi:MAG TPA: hypothetical protein PLV45_16110, partial [bacterium]|nr:hypothetical protein [bacterium]
MKLFTHVNRLLIMLCLVILATAGVSAQDSLICEDASGCDTDTVTISVLFSNPTTEVDAVTITMSFPDDILDFDSCAAGTVVPPGGWILFDCNDPSPNVLTIAGFAIDPIPTGSSGILVYLNFTVNCPTCVEGQTGLLDFTLLEDDVSGFTSAPGTFTYTCGATPTETPIPTDTPTNTPIPTDTPTNTPEPTNTPIPTDTPTNTPEPTATPTNTPEPTNTPVPTPPDIVINEVYYDDPGTDESSYVEIYGPAGTSLDGVVLQPRNQDCIDQTPVDLTGQVIPGDQFFVVGATGVANVDLVADSLNSSLQNGPCDSVWLVFNGTDIDGVRYGDDCSGEPLSCGEGAPVPEPGTDYSIGRIPDGADTDDNATDFS